MKFIKFVFCRESSVYVKGLLITMLTILFGKIAGMALQSGDIFLAILFLVASFFTVMAVVSMKV
jgi:hypothetical protein